jgi:hypothetical protein
MLKRALPDKFPIRFVSPILTVYSRKDTLPLRLAAWVELRILFDDNDDRPPAFVSTTQRFIQLQYELVEKISRVC